jgi:hypothetical protein
MLDCAMAAVAFLDDVASIFAYKNWYEGEVVAGPSVTKYWVTIVLKYDHKKMPEPIGAKVLTKLGCKVFYKQFKQKVEAKVVGPQDLDLRHRPKTVTEPCWLVKIVIPKKFIENEELKGVDDLDQEIDVDQIEEVLNAGGDNSALVNNDEELAPENNQQGGQQPVGPAPAGQPAVAQSPGTKHTPNPMG